ncbi:cytochrome c oxidase accessory protein CcoG [Mariniblastus fucicola]|uniref:Electron transport protein YccM n=1 Tax=Mariniblastus fucicola TaxID=980251 RepID=A0A5B9P671_9BACT|nr:cytochrome c oxidase accessory protein CcoG [Mariniblastus fucicola]QEG20420.1 Putative electron transport protein YccM [Mariniblastus fucicola]
MDEVRPEASGAFLEPEEHVLSTLEADGSRRWLKPKLSKGTLLERRRIVAYVLIAIFTIVPFIKVGGKPFVLLDITARRFTIFGFTFLPTDTMLLAIFLVGVLLSVVLFTALFGRVWCGWACPQTVYMEFLFRPVERFFDGTVGRGGHKKNIPAWRQAAKYVVFFLLCVYLANTFLAYFIGVDRLSQWVTQSPLLHPVPFAVMAFVTFAMMVDFCYFREQMCLIACPYGRFQSVLLDQDSLIVAYDKNRGEPRGRMKKAKSDSLPVVGDCIDCKKCVTTCPTGIDIRQGLQMECINCTQCIDACNDVMKSIGRSPDLIRYSSQSRDEGLTTSLLRARTLIYPTLLLGIAAAFFTVFFMSKTFDAALLREPGNPHTLTEDGQVRNILKLKLTNRTDEPMDFEVQVENPANAVIELQEADLVVQPRETRTFHIGMIAPKDAFSVGRADSQIIVSNQNDVSRTLSLKLIGPYN